MIEFPDPELIATTALRSVYSDYYVGREVPSTTRNRMITVRRIGGHRENVFVEAVRLGVNVYADTDLKANALSSEVRTLFETFTEVPGIVRVRTEGITEVPNNTTLSQRYFIVYLDIRGTAFSGRKE